MADISGAWSASIMSFPLTTQEQNTDGSAIGISR